MFSEVSLFFMEHNSLTGLKTCFPISYTSNLYNIMQILTFWCVFLGDSFGLTIYLNFVLEKNGSEDCQR